MNDEVGNFLAEKQPRPWDRLPAETDRAFAMFCEYRNLGPQGRSLSVLCEKHGAGRRSVIARWSSTHNWVERVAAYDSHINQRLEDAEFDALRDMQKVHVEEARSLQDIAVESLRRYREEMDRNPKKRLSEQAILQYITQAANLERLTRGQATEIREEQSVLTRTFAELIAKTRTERNLDPDKEIPFLDTADD